MTLSSLRSKISNINVHPTEPQKHAGNYRKGHVRIHGLDITIENPKGSIRKGTSHDGKKWKSTLPDHYGYIKRSVGADGDHVDVYCGPDHSSKLVYVIDQKHHEPDGKNHGRFDEHKCMLCYPGYGEAVKAYRAAFSDNHDRVLNVTILTILQFKRWLRAGSRKPHPRHWSHQLLSRKK